MVFTYNYHQYFKELSSHQPSHMPTPDTGQKVILILHFLIIQKLKNVISIPSNSYAEQPTKFASKLHFQVYVKKKI